MAVGWVISTEINSTTPQCRLVCNCNWHPAEACGLPVRIWPGIIQVLRSMPLLLIVHNITLLLYYFTVSLTWPAALPILCSTQCCPVNAILPNSRTLDGHTLRQNWSATSQYYPLCHSAGCLRWFGFLVLLGHPCFRMGLAWDYPGVGVQGERLLLSMSI